MDIVPYLSFDGRCAEAFAHYAKVLRGDILAMIRGKDMPPAENMPPEFAERVMHARLQVGGRLLMGGDAPIDRASTPQGYCVNLMIDDPVEAERVFRELTEGGTIMMPMDETFWARCFGMGTDRFGTPWMVNCEKPMGVPETSGTPFTIARSFDVPRERLWRCFSDAASMKPWWGPKGATIVEARMDFRPGGRFHYGMRMPDGTTTIWGRARYREIVPMERIVYVNAFADAHGALARHPMAPTWPVEMHTVFEFGDDGPGRSRFSVTWSPILPTPEERATFDNGHESMRQGWTGTLDRLAAHLAQA